VFGRHGVLDEERRDGQTFVFDVELEIQEPAQDSIAETVDYRVVAARIGEVSDSARFQLLETLAAAAADALIAEFEATRVRVRVRKPRPRGIAAEWSAATAERRRPEP
jgi:dihydroneopterin aldolase